MDFYFRIKLGTLILFKLYQIGLCTESILCDHIQGRINRNQIGLCNENRSQTYRFGFFEHSMTLGQEQLVFCCIFRQLSM